MHGGVAQSETQQQARELQVARHFAAHGDRHAAARRGLDGVCHQR